MAKRVIVIAGATGNQGGSVVKALANHPDFDLRALTRDPNKPAAQELTNLGSNISLVACDLNNRESLLNALAGAYGFYCLTDYFAHPIQTIDDITEEKEGRFMADVAKEAGVKHFIYSTLPEIKEYSGGKYLNVHHFDGKSHIEQYARSLGFEIASFVAPSCYMQNFMGGSTRKEGDTVVFSLPLPSLKSSVPACDITHDLGVVVKAVFELGPEANGQLYPVVSEFIEAERVASDFQRVTGIPARFDLVPNEVFLKIVGQYQGDLVALDLLEMFHAFADYGFAAAGTPEALNKTKQLGVHLNTWAEVLEQTGWKGPE